MKNSFFVFLMSVLIASSAQAQKKKPVQVKQVQVPENVNTSFKSQYTVTNDNSWKKNYSGNYVATFTNADSLKQTVEFSGSGTMIKSKIAIAPQTIAENLSLAISTQYPGSKITEADKMQLPGVAPYYRVKILSSDNTTKELLISEEGTITE